MLFRLSLLRAVAKRLSLLSTLACGPFIALHAQHPVNVGVQYEYTRSNVLPGCNCFGLQGAGIQVQYGLLSRIALLGDFGVAHRGNITPDGYALTQYTYTAGLRYLAFAQRRRLHPFGEVSLGAAHAAGSLSPGSSGVGGSSNAFALQAGGGLQLSLTRRLTLQPIEADYLLTTFHNGNADRQNDLKLAAGLLFRFGK